MRNWLFCSAVFLVSVLHAQVSDIAFDANPDFLKLPPHVYLGEVAGVATNSKSHLFVYTRTGAVGTLGGSRLFTHGGSRLLEFDGSGKYVREIGQGVYGFLFAQSLRVDREDNIWAVDKGSGMVVKFDPTGKIALLLGRKPESIDVGNGGRAGANTGAGIPGDTFSQAMDVAWDAAGNIFIADGHRNARIAKFDKNGKYVKSWGTKGTGQGQFNEPSSLAVDGQGNLYVADSGNKRIQVFDGQGTFRQEYTNIGTPHAICVSGGSHPYLFSSNSNETNSMENGEIYKMELDGRVLGKFGKAGKTAGEFGTVNQMDCRNPALLYVGELTNWRVQQLKLR